MGFGSTYVRRLSSNFAYFTLGAIFSLEVFDFHRSKVLCASVVDFAPLTSTFKVNSVFAK